MRDFGKTDVYKRGGILIAVQRCYRTSVAAWENDDSLLGKRGFLVRVLSYIIFLLEHRMFRRYVLIQCINLTYTET